jgi:hypothetical protein
MPLQFARGQLGAVGLAQRKSGQGTGLREQGDASGLRPLRAHGPGSEILLRGQQPQAGGQGDDEDETGSAVEHELGLTGDGLNKSGNRSW